MASAQDCLTADQEHSFCCIVCDVSFTGIAVDHQVVGYSRYGSLFACTTHHLPAVTSPGWSFSTPDSVRAGRLEHQRSQVGQRTSS